MEKREQIIELIKEDSWYNIPVENTTDKIFSILCVINRRDLLIGLLTKLENGGGSAFIDKEQIVDDYLKAN